jgi:hypothetical protein
MIVERKYVRCSYKATSRPLLKYAFSPLALISQGLNDSVTWKVFGLVFASCMESPRELIVRVDEELTAKLTRRGGR